MMNATTNLSFESTEFLNTCPLLVATEEEGKLLNHLLPSKEAKFIAGAVVFLAVVMAIAQYFVEDEEAEAEDSVTPFEFTNSSLFTEEGDLVPRVFDEKLSTIYEEEETVEEEESPDSDEMDWCYTLDEESYSQEPTTPVYYVKTGAASTKRRRLDRQSAEETETVDSSFPIMPDDLDENEEASPIVESEEIAAPAVIEEPAEIVAPTVVEPEEDISVPTGVEPEPIVAPTPRRTQTNRAKHAAQLPQTLRRSSRLSGDAAAMSLGTIYVRRSDRLRSKPRVKYSA